MSVTWKFTMSSYDIFALIIMSLIKENLNFLVVLFERFDDHLINGDHNYLCR